MERGEDNGNNKATWRLRDRLVEVRFPMVMGILNATPDSFHKDSRVGVDAALHTAESMLRLGLLKTSPGGSRSA